MPLQNKSLKEVIIKTTSKLNQKGVKNIHNKKNIAKPKTCTLESVSSLLLLPCQHLVFQNPYPRPYCKLRYIRLNISWSNFLELTL